MVKYHISKQGIPAVCKAKKGNCPLGGEEQHFETKEDAQAYSDKKNQEKFAILPELKKNTNNQARKSKPSFRIPRTAKDREYIENQKIVLKNESEEETYIERCRYSRVLKNYQPLKKSTYHHKEHRKRRVDGLKREFGEGNLIGYYEVCHKLEKTNKYKKQVMELRDNGIMTVYDAKSKKTVTTFIPHRARIEAMMIMAGQIPDNKFLGRAIENKKRAKKLKLDD